MNHSFDSQTKENMPLPANKFGSKCNLPPKFFTLMTKSGIIESVIAWSKFNYKKDPHNNITNINVSELIQVAVVVNASVIVSGGYGCGDERL